MVTIREGNGTFFENLLMELSSPYARDTIALQTEELCLRQAPEVCVERSTGYLETIMLPPSPSGYTLTYMRCCRNTSTINIENPIEAGNTYLIEIPPGNVADCNSSPVFNNLPPIVLCAGYPFSFDHSAIDADGDELTYKLCAPLDFPDALEGNAVDYTTGEAGPKPPFETLVWESYFNVNNQIGGTPPMQIDEQTGLLTAFPDRIGRYVIGICVEERRNGVLLNTTTRDYQLLIEDCDVVQAEVETDEIDVEGNFILRECANFLAQFKNTSEGTEDFFWQFGDTEAAGADTSSLRNPSYQYPDTGIYEILLIANPDKLCADTANIKLNLYPKLEVDFDWEATCAETAMQFTNNSSSDFGFLTAYSWNFGDGNTSNQAAPENIFTTSGSYEVFLTVSNSYGCTRETVKQVRVKPNPQVDFGNTPVCIEQQPVNFSDLSQINLGNIVNRLWEITDEAGNILYQSEQPNIEYTFSTPGNYNIVLTATSDDGCIATALNSITLQERLLIDAGIDRDVCIGSSIVLNGQANTPVTFMWNADVPILIDDNTLQNPTITPYENTMVTVLATDPNGCTNRDSLQLISRQLPTVNAGVNDSLCLGDRLNLNGLGETTGTGQISYQWLPNSFINNPNISNPFVEPQEDITYYLTITESEFNCANTDSVFVKVIFPLNDFTSSTFTTCQLQPVQLNVAGGDFYNWQPPAGLDSPATNNPIATLAETTNYIVEISNYCFSAEAAVLVNVLPAPAVDAGNDVTINIGDLIELNATVEANAESIEWWPAIDILSGAFTANPQLQPLQSRDYIITATAENGCSLSDTISVTVNNIFKLWIPNAFSPNNDGSNDVIAIQSKGIKNIEVFKIYNRYGQNVFETNDITATWNGTFKGKPLPPGVYVYYAIGITYLDEFFKDQGNITLIR